MATEISQIQMGIPGPSGAGVSAAQWAALQLKVASATTGLFAELLQAEQAAPSTPASGRAILYPDTAGNYAAIDDNGTVWSVGRMQKKSVSANQTITTTSMTSIGDLAFTLLPSTIYEFEYVLSHRSTDATTGLKLEIDIPSAVLNAINYRTEIQVLNTANGTDNVEIQNHVAVNSVHTAANQAAVSTDSIAIIKGIVNVAGTGGVMRPRFAGDSTAGSITIKQGSSGRLWV